MPTVKVPRSDVSRDEVMEALRQDLGPDYKVKAGSHDGVFSVDKGTFTGAKVHMKPEGESTRSTTSTAPASSSAGSSTS